MTFGVAFGIDFSICFEKAESVSIVRNVVLSHPKASIVALIFIKSLYAPRMPPTQFVLFGKVAPLPTFEAPLCRFYKVPIPWAGTQGNPRASPKGPK